MLNLQAMNKSRNMVNNTQSKLFHYNELKYLFPSTPWNNFFFVPATKIPDNYFQFNPHYFSVLFFVYIFFCDAIPNYSSVLFIQSLTPFLAHSFSLYIHQMIFSHSLAQHSIIPTTINKNGLILINKFIFILSLEKFSVNFYFDCCSVLCIAP